MKCVQYDHTNEIKAIKEIFTVTVLIICCTLRGGSPVTPLEAAVLPC